MLILAVNVAFAVIFALINPRYIISFEVAFVGAGLVFYSSYRAIMQKVMSFAGGAESMRESAESNQNSALDSALPANTAESTPDNLPKKERFFLGAKISFGLLRILSYAFLGISIIALINNGAFYAFPFLAGIALSTLTSALYVARKGKSATL